MRGRPAGNFICAITEVRREESMLVRARTCRSVICFLSGKMECDLDFPE